MSANIYEWSHDIPTHPCWFFAKGPRVMGVPGGRKISVGRVYETTDHTGHKYLMIDPPDLAFNQRLHPGAVMYAEIPGPFTDREIATGGEEE